MRSVYDAAGHYVSLVKNPWRGMRYSRVQIIRFLLKRMQRYGVALAA